MSDLLGGLLMLALIVGFILLCWTYPWVILIVLALWLLSVDGR